jgi:hypothetical protein
MDLWEWDVRVLDIQQGIEDDHTPPCLGGRGAPPPEHCGGPRGYRLMLKRQQEGGAIADPASVEEQYGPLEPNRFSLKETNERLSVLVEDGRLRS